MIHFLLFIFLQFLSPLSASYHTPKVIYGEDNREDIINSQDQLMIEKSRSVAGMFKYTSLSPFSIKGFKVRGKTLTQREWCSSERFSEQITAPVCSGFLVGQDTLVTAGHCVKSKFDCLRYLWVFDYKIQSTSHNEVTIPTKNIYRCKEIIMTIKDPGTSIDFAIIKLSRKVLDRNPLEWRTSGKIPDDASLVLIGHPKGLPLKIADGAKILDNSHQNFFISNTDSYGGNSGSPVLNQKTGLVEGILVRGDIDFETTPEGCNISKVCKENECSGEDATRMTLISTFLKNKNKP